MPWTDWITPDPEIITVADWVRTPAIVGGSSVQFIPKLLAVSGAPGGSRYWTRWRYGTVESHGSHMQGGYVLFDDGMPDSSWPQSSWLTAKAGGTISATGFIDYSAEGTIGYNSEMNERDTDTDNISDSTEFETNMRQVYARGDFTEILAYRARFPNEYTSHRTLVQSLDFHFPDEGEGNTWIEHHPDDSSSLVGGMLRTSGRDTVFGNAAQPADKDHTVRAYRDTGLSLTSNPGWVAPGSLGSLAATWNALVEGIYSFDWSGALSGTQFGIRMVSAVCEGGWPGFDYEWTTPYFAGDNEAAPTGLDQVYLVAQYPRFRYWTKEPVEPEELPPLRMRQRDDDVVPAEGSGVIPSPRIGQGTIEAPGDRDRMRSVQRSRRIRYGPNSYL